MSAPDPIAVEPLVRALGADLMALTGWMNGIPDMARRGDPTLDASFAFQLGQRVADAIRAGAVVTPNGDVIMKQGKQP